MILTCQQVYYEEIYEDISKEGANTKNITVDTIRRWNDRITPDSKLISFSDPKYSLQGTTQGRYLTGGVPPVRFSM